MNEDDLKEFRRLAKAGKRSLAKPGHRSHISNWSRMCRNEVFQNIIKNFNKKNNEKEG